MHHETVHEALSVLRLLREPLRSILQPMEPAIQKLFSLDRLLQLYRDAENWDQLLALAGIDFRIDAEDLQNIPRTGP